MELDAPASSDDSITSRGLWVLSSPTFKHKSTIAGEKYRIGTKLAQGTFGEVRLGKNLQTNDLVIVKLEPIKTKVPTVVMEFTFYHILGSTTGGWFYSRVGT